MSKYWYVVHDGKEYLIGFCYGKPESTEGTVLECMKEYCKNKSYRLALLIQVFPMLPIVNQVHPEKPTEESRYCLDCTLQAMEQV